MPLALSHVLEAELDTIAKLITVFFVLSGIAIALRIYVRARLLKHFGADDWVMIVAYVSFIPYHLRPRKRLTLLQLIYIALLALTYVSTTQYRAIFEGHPVVSTTITFRVCHQQIASLIITTNAPNRS